MKKVISICPVCSHELTVARLKCDSCDTVIENNFRLSRFDYLSDEELYFTETFIRCRGNIKEVEKGLGISYPTVRAKLDAVIKKLGFEVGADEQTVKKEEILKALENGEITAEQGAELMSALNTDLPSQQTALKKNSYDKKMLRVIVDSVNGDKVKIQFPVGAVKKILKVTGKLPIPEKDLQGVDLSSMMEAISECLDDELEGDFVNVEAADGTIVKVFVGQ